MRNTIIHITAVLLLTLGMALTACGSKATATASQSPAGQSTATHPPVILATATPPPTVQATASEPPPIQITATQPPAIQVTATPASGGDGPVLLNERCTICHNLNRVISLRNTADQWNRIVSAMIQNGALLTPAEQTVLVNYLAKTYGP